MTEIADRKNGLPFRRYAHRIYAIGERIVAGAIRSLRNTDQPMISYIWRAWLIAIIPALLISTIVNLVFELPGPAGLAPKDPASNASPTIWLVGTLLVSPWGGDSSYVADLADSQVGHSLEAWDCCGICDNLGEHSFAIRTHIGPHSRLGVLYFFSMLSGVGKEIDRQGHHCDGLCPHVPERCTRNACGHALGSMN